MLSYFFAIIATFIWKALKEFYLPKRARIIFEWKDPCKVGQTVAFRIVFVERENRRTVSDLVSKTSIKIVHNTQPVTFIKEPVQIDNNIEIRVKFSVQQSGRYAIRITYDGKEVPGSPFAKTFLPDEIHATKTTFLRPSPALSLVAYKTSVFNIQPKDRFGNLCKSKDIKLGGFSFVAQIADESRMDEELSVNLYSCNFCKGYGDNINVELDCFCAGIYNCSIKYNDEVVQYGNFDMVVMDCQEESLMKNIINDNPSWTYHEAKLLALGTEVQNRVRKMYIYVSPKLFYIREYFLKIIPIRIATFRVSPMTKIKMLIVNNETKTYTFSLFDGVGPKVTLEMNSSRARIVMGMFNQFLKKRLGGMETFEGKQRIFYQELKGTLKDMRASMVEIKVNRNDLISSTIAATKSFRRNNWCKNFRIKFVDELGIDTGGLRREWLELLCVQMFQNKSDGMFCCIGNSRLVHPNPASSRDTSLTLKHYQFAGQIVGKCLFESAWGDSSKQMVNARFSRSFLAQIIGLKPEYKHFEQDDPELFLGKVKYILENDVESMEPLINFTEEEYDAKGKLLQTVDLISNGKSKTITNENKENFLMLLAQYRLGFRVKKEIEAFVKGLYDIVPEELLTNFDENELELLLCGKSEFDLEDLKKHHVDGGWGWDPNYGRVLSWFYSAIANMTDDEKARLLQFTTGSSLLPHGKFKALNPPFKITLASTFGKLPTAHTCFNQICLSDNVSFEQFEKALRTAIQEGGEGFSFA